MAEVVFCKSVTPGDPNERPCTILGKPKNLESLPFSAVAPFLAPRVTEEVVSKLAPLVTWMCMIFNLSDVEGGSQLPQSLI